MIRIAILGSGLMVQGLLNKLAGRDQRSGSMIHDKRFMVMTDTTMIDMLKQFVESDMRSCSMDIGGISPIYVYRMWGGAVAIEDIATAMEDMIIEVL